MFGWRMSKSEFWNMIRLLVGELFGRLSWNVALVTSSRNWGFLFLLLFSSLVKSLSPLRFYLCRAHMVHFLCGYLSGCLTIGPRQSRASSWTVSHGSMIHCMSIGRSCHISLRQRPVPNEDSEHPGFPRNHQGECCQEECRRLESKSSRIPI